MPNQNSSSSSTSTLLSLSPSLLQLQLQLPSSSSYIIHFIWTIIITVITIISSASANPNSKPIIMLPTDHHHHHHPTCSSPDPSLNYRPVIGIVSHPGDGASGRIRKGANVSYVAASYVKFVESAGARVIPIIYTDPLELIFKKLDLTNGVLFTGGWSKKGLYFDVVQKIFKKVIEKNDRGEHFPCYGICLGLELLAMIISKDNDILERFDARDMSSSLQFVESGSLEGTVFQRFPPELLKKLETDCLVMQHHQYGISPHTFQGNQDLSSFFNILTTSRDRDNKDYVSTAQARQYPVTAFQWHPEKNAFEWGSPTIPHSEDAIQVTQQVANYFISEARKSPNRPPNEEVLECLIYNYSPTYSGNKGSMYDEVYIFPSPMKM